MIGTTDVAALPASLAKLLKNDARRAEKNPDTYSDDGVVEGYRNDYLTSIAGTLRKRGLSPRTIEAALTVHNAERCKPPLPPHEVRRISQSIGEKPDGDAFAHFRQFDIDYTIFGHSEMDYAKLLARYFRDKICYVREMDRWLIFNGRFWEIDWGRVEMRRLITEGLSALHGAADAITGKSGRETFQALVKSKESKRAIDAIIDLAASVDGVAIGADTLDANPWLFNVADGTLDLKAGTIRPFDPVDYITKISLVHCDPDATCPRWERFLAEIIPVIAATPADPDEPGDSGDPGRSEEEATAIIGYLQRLFGYALTGSAREQSVTFFFGNGKNGKSTYLDIMAAVLGNYWIKTPAQTLMQRRDAGIRNDLARLKGARAVVTSEINQGVKLDEAILKDLAGGIDEIPARFLYGEYFTFKPTFTLIMYGNHRPVINGTDEGIWRRVHLVPFTYSVPEERRELDLPDQLRTELPGILNWAIRGALDWQRTGLNPPASIVAATKAYREEMDSIGRFIETCCAEEADARTSMDDLYRAYQNQATKLGTFAKSRQNFGEELSKHGIGKKKANSTIYRTGITLNADGWAFARWQPPLGQQ